MMKEKEFYKECVKIVGTESEYTTPKKISKRFNRETGEMYQPPTSATRWGGREPGNGRFPGLGLIRCFGSNCIQVNIKNPTLSKTYESYEEALDALREVFSKETKPLEVGDFVHAVFMGEDFGMCKIVKYDEEYSCWKIKVKEKFLNGHIEVTERFYYEK